MKKQKKKQLNQVQNQAQDGRSMVEMLGVLAIIGVISVGGIAGYRWGMNKHVANQILYEMNLNSAQLAMLLQKGNPDGVTLALGSPYDEGKFRTVDYGFKYGCGEYATCGHACQNPDGTGYFMTATGLPKQVCNMLGDAVFGMAYYYDSEINENDECKDTENTVTVFFNTNATAEGETSPRPENPDNPSTPTPEVTAATPTTATTLAPTTAPTTLAPTTAAPETTTIDQNCSGHGTWNGSSCNCNWGYIGEDCSKACSEHGAWCGSFCLCHGVGWGGEDCSQQGYCNNQGEWTNYKGGYCYQCEDGYGGRNCETENMCNGKGTWYNNSNGTGYCYCIYNSGWYGTYCDKCSGNGAYYNANTGKCTCNSGWSGDDCEIETN